MVNCLLTLKVLFDKKNQMFLRVTVLLEAFFLSVIDLSKLVVASQYAIKHFTDFNPFKAKQIRLLRTL